MPDSLLRTDKEIAQIYARHVDTVYRVCFMFLKNAFDAQDAVQNTFIKLMQHAGAFENEQHEKAWLIVTASNLCKDFLKHWWRRTQPIEDADRQAAHGVHEIDETLGKILALPEKYKVPIYLYYYERYTSVEIARMLGKNESTVRGLLARGRNLLKLELDGDVA